MHLLRPRFTRSRCQRETNKKEWPCRDKKCWQRCRCIKSTTRLPTFELLSLSRKPRVRSDLPSRSQGRGSAQILWLGFRGRGSPGKIPALKHWTGLCDTGTDCAAAAAQRQAGSFLLCDRYGVDIRPPPLTHSQSVTTVSQHFPKKFN